MTEATLAARMALLAEVAVPVPLSHAFSYAVPDAIAAEVRPGARVVCQFGPRRLLGVVLTVADREPPPGIKALKPIGAVVEIEAWAYKPA